MSAPSFLLLDHLPQSPYSKITSANEGGFWDSLWAMCTSHPDAWRLVEGTVAQVRRSWGTYAERSSLMHSQLHIIEVKSPILAVRIKYGIGIAIAPESSWESETHDRQFRNDRRMPDWRIVIDTTRVSAKSRQAVYNSIRDMAMRFNLPDLKFTVSPPQGAPDINGDYIFICTRKKAAPIDHNKAYEKMRRMQRKGQQVPPEILFEAQKCPAQERELLRPYFNALARAYKQGTLFGDFKAEYLTTPIDEARYQRKYCNESAQYRAQWMLDHGFEAPTDSCYITADDLIDAPIAAPIAQPPQEAAEGADEYVPTANEQTVINALEALKMRLDAGVDDLQAFKAEIDAAYASWPPHGDISLAMQVSAFLREVDKRITAMHK